MPKEGVEKVIEESGGRRILTELESKKILSIYGIPVTLQRLTKTVDEAVKVAGEIGYPVVLKIVSPDISHKSDAGCVKLDLNSPNEVKRSYSEILRAAHDYKPDANILGVLVQEMIEDKVAEVIVGSKTDLIFGPLVVFGLGGIFAELLRDVSIRVVPFSRDDAFEMIREIRGHGIFEGYRGQPPADVESVVDIILEVAELVQDFDVISEVDLNPIYVSKKGRGSMVIDARMILTQS